MATIRKRGDKWHVQVRRKSFSNLTRTFTRKADAIEWAREAERTVERRGLSTDPRILERLTVSDVLTRYRNNVVPLRRGRKNETIVINAFLRNEVAKTRLSELGATQFAAYRDERLRAVKPATVNREFSLLQHAFEVARKEWGIPLSLNPVGAVRKPKADKPRERRLGAGEWERVMQACGKCRNKLIEPFISFAVETAMRRSEILNAKWRDVNWASHTLQIPLTKNGHSRTIPLCFRALSIIAGLGNVHSGDEHIFPLSSESVKLAWQRLVVRAGIEGLHFHDLRHEAVSRFFELGLTVPEVALISGHRDPRMLFRYTHLKAEDVAQRISHLTGLRG